MRKLLLIMAIVLSFGALTAPSALAKPPEGTIPVPPPPGPGDTTPPTITINTPKDGATYNTGRYFYADYSCADEKGGSGLKSCDGTVANDTPGPVANGSSISTTREGDFTFTVNAEDNAGNTNSKTVQYHVRPGQGPGPGPTDTTAPTIIINTPAQGDTYNKSDTPSVKTDFSCSDPDGPADVKLCQGYVDNDSANPQGSGASLDIKSLAAGSHTLTVNAQDNAGNKAVPVVVHFEVTDKDTIPPTIHITKPIEGDTYNEGDTVKADYLCLDEIGGSGLKSCVGDVANGSPIDTSTPGDYTFTVNAEDNAGNKAVPVVVHFKVTDNKGGGDTGGSSNPEGSGSSSGGGNQRVVETTVGVFSALLGQGKLPDTGGGWAVLLVTGGLLIGGGGLLIRRFLFS